MNTYLGENIALVSMSMSATGTSAKVGTARPWLSLRLRFRLKLRLRLRFRLRLRRFCAQIGCGIIYIPWVPTLVPYEFPTRQWNFSYNAQWMPKRE